MSNNGQNFTPEQEAAISYRGGALLVSAAAGSGKTRVLVERLLSRITSGDNIDEFLVITYTRAAASELRERICDGILEKLADSPGNRRLRRQSMLCRGASIDTIHGFCADILRENAHKTGLAPGFRIIDESESEMVKADVLEDVLNSAYENLASVNSNAASESTESDVAPISGFAKLVDLVSPGRDDRRLAGIILDTHSRLRSCPNPAAWAEKQADMLLMSGVADVSETVWGAYLIEKARRTVRYRYAEMTGLREEMRLYPEFESKYGDSVDASISDIQAFMSALEVGWDEAQRFSKIDFSRVKPKPVSNYDELKAVRSRCKDAINECVKMFECSSDECLADMKAVAPAMTALMQLVLEFDRAYSVEKRRRNAVDFPDLEHLTLSLLIDIETGERTELAESISRRFKEIMVDEYQDVNAVQELLFNAVSQNGANIFMVGDVKQSIYRFRLADPSIFLGKYRRYPGIDSISTGTPEAACEGVKILLSSNFRSHYGILDTVNRIFSKIMSTEFGEMDYTKDEYLIPGRIETGFANDNSGYAADNAGCIPAESVADNEAENAAVMAVNNVAAISSAGAAVSGGSTGAVVSAVEINLIDLSGMEQDEEEESPSKTQVEAGFVASRIRELIDGGYMIPDGQGALRKLRFSDIVILLRSVRGKSMQYAAALSELEIPTDMQSPEDYFETIEISAALSLLSVIDNPMQDIPLAATLCGPIYGFSADILAGIRAGSPGTDFYTALVKGAEDNEKCASFLGEIDAFRLLAPDYPADRFIWHVYSKTGLPGRVGAMKGGDRRRGNLIQLVEYARSFEQSGYKGLFSFLTYMRGLQERGVELTREAGPSPNTASADAVRIMSIHKSKGLEFPVVILADTAKRFNFKDSQLPLVIHSELGFGPKRVNRERRIMYPTVARLAVQDKLASEMMAEELRVLYVAMTRAREKLIITATIKDEDELEKLAQLTSGGCIQPQMLEEVKNVAKWILMPLLNGGVRTENGKLILDRTLFVDAYIRKPALSESSAPIGDVQYEPDGAPVLTPNQIPDDAPDYVPYSATTLTLDHAPDHVPALPPETANAEDIERLRKRFSFVYPHEKATELPSKLTVTELKRRETGQIADESLKKTRHRITGSDDSIKRSDESHVSMSAAERGTALHRAMQCIDFGKCGTIEGVKNELQRLAQKGHLTAAQAAVVDASKITRFFSSVLGKRLLAAGNARREFKFSLLYPAERFFPCGGEDEILLQGVVDCFFEENGELVVVDFKTDHVTPETIDEKAASYEPQLSAYTNALWRITGKNVKESVIYFFGMDYSHFFH